MKARDTKKAIDADSRWNTKQENKRWERCGEGMKDFHIRRGGPIKTDTLN
jgi:hypothetical protein